LSAKSEHDVGSLTSLPVRERETSVRFVRNFSELGEVSGRVGNTVCRGEWNQRGIGKKIESERLTNTGSSDI
jgi:hypothetical protein